MPSIPTVDEMPARPVSSDAVGPVDPIDNAAWRAFTAAYGAPDLGPVAVVIPAYREAENISAVIQHIPSEVLGHRLATLVVVDGADEETTKVAVASGAFVCVATINRGQGAALRLGYRIARADGALYLVSIDADGQYDPAEIPMLLEPILCDEADFVSGSRRLGANFQHDRVRELGVAAYVSLVSVLTGCRITDPSFGLRAMRAEVPAAVSLRQPQYQAAELLVGAIMKGFRIAERPATMRARTSGRSHKGSNLLYGWRFGTVVVSTWHRERSLRRQGGVP